MRLCEWVQSLARSGRGVQPRLFRMIGSYPIRKPPSKRSGF
jgi:hypothetical protein